MPGQISKGISEHQTTFAVADPGFARRGSNPWVDINLLFGKFSQKLHEKEEILGPSRLLDSPLFCTVF